MSSVVNYRTEYSDRLRAEGREEGRAEGAERATRRLLWKLVASRGIVLTDRQRARIEDCCDAEVLERWTDRALTASTAAEIFE
ncbi:hypothetical protein GCM10027440_31700 [Nocardiopsis coralliicola]